MTSSWYSRLLAMNDRYRWAYKLTVPQGKYKLIIICNCFERKYFEYTTRHSIRTLHKIRVTVGNFVNCGWFVKYVNCATACISFFFSKNGPTVWQSIIWFGKTIIKWKQIYQYHHGWIIYFKRHECPAYHNWSTTNDILFRLITIQATTISLWYLRP